MSDEQTPVQPIETPPVDTTEKPLDLDVPKQEEVDVSSKQANKDEVEANEDALASGEDTEDKYVAVGDGADGVEGDDEIPKKKKKKRMVKKVKRKRSFDLNGIHHLEKDNGKYNA